MDSFDETISPTQTVKVHQFQEITGIDDLNRCRDILIRNGWDLEVAMQEVCTTIYSFVWRRQRKFLFAIRKWIYVKGDRVFMRQSHGHLQWSMTDFYSRSLRQKLQRDRHKGLVVWSDMWWIWCLTFATVPLHRF